MSMKGYGIDHVVINVADTERAMCWYRDRLGFEPERYEAVSYTHLRAHETRHEIV